MNLFNYHRRPTTVVHAGRLDMGGDNPVRIQSMTTTSTDDTEASVAQAERIIRAGGELVRLTTQGVKEAENMKNISAGIRRDGFSTPLVADVHFNPKVADVAALYCEGVRINPGNYVDPARRFIKREYTDAEYAEELQKIEDRLVPFLNICKEHHTAIRIGVNHGSLSDRIRNRYGDTPEGIVESCMEFLRICKKQHFDNVVISIKSSNTVVMVRSVRLLVATMDKEDMHYPLHLGVTEAGEGEDGRIKSAVGIGALLADGIGDTIRVSLSEEPEAEIPVARHLVDYIGRKAGHVLVPGEEYKGFDWLWPERRATTAVGDIGGGNVPVVIASPPNPLSKGEGAVTSKADYLYVGSSLPEQIVAGQKYIVDYQLYATLKNKEYATLKNKEERIKKKEKKEETGGQPSSVSILQSPVSQEANHKANSLSFGEGRGEASKLKAQCFPIFPVTAMPFIGMIDAPLKFLVLQFGTPSEEYLACLKTHPEVVVVCVSNHQNRLGCQRALVHEMMTAGLRNPVVFAQMYHLNDKEEFQLEAAADMGALMVDGLTDGLWLMNEGNITQAEIEDTAFGILQAGRLRMSKTEYISCPGCGRTLYDLQDTIKRIREALDAFVENKEEGIKNKEADGKPSSVSILQSPASQEANHNAQSSKLKAQSLKLKAQSLKLKAKNLKIGIMGCIVNGPGEMADADYGYVGAGPGKVSLYKGKVCVEHNIPESEAVEHLLKLIASDDK